MQQPKAPMRRSLRWLFFAIGCLTGLGLGLVLPLHEKRELASEQAVAKWESNWPQLKLGMSKEQVLGLVGAPTSTNVQEMKTTNVSVYPPNPNKERDAAQTAAKLDQKFSGAIWSYYGPIVIHTTPGEDVQTALGQAFDQSKPLLDINGKLQGHAIKFDGAGRIVEISPQ